MAKLTKAQLRELHELAGYDHWSYYNDGYKPIIRLLALGYVERKEPRTRLNGSYRITDSGRLALSDGSGNV